MNFLLHCYLCLTQSVVNGAPDAMSTLTSSACPLRDASNNLFPRSTSDDFSFSFILSGYTQYAMTRKPKTNWYSRVNGLYCINRETFNNNYLVLTQVVLFAGASTGMTKVMWL